MTCFDFSIPDTPEKDVIVFGNNQKKVEIDVSFIPSVKGFVIRSILLEKKDAKTPHTPEAFAKIIALFTNEVDVEWIVENIDYGTLDKIVAIILERAFGRVPVKN